jgi:hypothetical protein
MKNYFTLISIFSVFLFTSRQIAFGQNSNVIKVANKSFEGKPVIGVSYFNLSKWKDRGSELFAGETPPDIHPIGAWGNNMLPTEGASYIGLVMRDNETFESVYQKLLGELIADSCYKFSIDIGRSRIYSSRSRITDQKTNYIQPTIFRLVSYTHEYNFMKEEVLAYTQPIDYFGWESYDFVIKPKKNVSRIALENYFNPEAKVPYNGHILLDNMSDFTKISCPVEKQAP